MKTNKPARAIATMLLALAGIASGLAAAAPTWPDRPVTVIMPYKPGGGGETFVRLIMQQVAKDTGHSFVIENRPGGSGTIGAGFVAKEQPDGYTLLGSGVASIVIAPFMFHVHYDPIKDFTHIALFGGPPPALAVTGKFPAQTLRQYVDISRREARGVTYASSGHGTHVQLMAELFKSLSGANLLEVPYNGGGPAMADLIGGHVASVFATLGTIAPYAHNGNVRLLAIAAPQRVHDFPDVPTFAELGYRPMTSVTWFGLSGPAGLPRDIVMKLNAEVRAALAKPAVRKALEAEAIEPGNLDPDAFTRFIRDEIARWGPLARKVRQ
jgi:tripartite-type tricarboxylate transporter receptor subunit TctC